MAISDKYWADLPTSEIGSQLSAKLKGSDLDSETSFHLHRTTVDRAHVYYYSAIHDDDEGKSSQYVTRGGDQQELAQIRVNYARSLAQAQLQVVTGAKISWDCQAVNSTYKSQSAAIAGDALLEYEWKQNGLSDLCVAAVEQAIPYGESFILTLWDPTRGQNVAAVGNKLFKAGDISYYSVPTWDVIRDSSRPSYEACDWFIVRIERNRFELAALYPKQRDAILAAGQANKLDALHNRTPTTGNSDYVATFYFFHRKTAALPRGREIVFLESGDVLHDEPRGLSYRCIPLHRMKAGDRVGTPYPYSAFWETLATQELSDSYQTQIATVNSTFGTPLLIAQHGADLAPDLLSGGPHVLYINPDSKPPQYLQPGQVDAGVYNHLGSLKADQRQLMGLNDVALGQAPSGEMNAQAFALLGSMAVQNNSRLQGMYVEFVRNLGKGILNILEDRMPQPRKVAITGKNGQPQELKVTKEDLAEIENVYIDIGNSLSQTAAGRLTIAQQHLELLGPSMTVEQLQQVLDTGRLEPLTQGLQSQLLLIQAENEKLAAGEPVPAYWQDNHALHAREHATVLASLEARMSPEVLAAVDAHIREHHDLLLNTDPNLLALTGQQPLPPPAGTQPPAPGATDGTAPPASFLDSMNASNQPPAPSIPKNPLTGDEFSPTEPPIK